MRLRRLREAGAFVTRIKVSGARCQVSGSLVAEREVLLDAIFVRGMNEFRATQAATALGTLALTQVTATRAGAQNLAARRDLEALGN